MKIKIKFFDIIIFIIGIVIIGILVTLFGEIFSSELQSKLSTGIGSIFGLIMFYRCVKFD